MTAHFDFLIFSTPRSGSAWLANFLTHGDCFCYHEPLAAATIDLPRHAPITGAVDTGAWMFRETLPAVPKLYALRREPRRVARSLRQIELPADVDFGLFADATRDLVTFEYERLFDVAYLRGLWEQVVGAGFDEARARQLIEFNVQRDLAALEQTVQRTYAGV